MGTLTLSPLVLQEPTSGSRTYTVVAVRSDASATETVRFIIRNGSSAFFYGSAVDQDFVGFANDGPGARRFSIEFAAGETSKSFELTVVGDTIREGADYFSGEGPLTGVEFFDVAVSSTSAGYQNLTGYIIDSDLPPSVLTIAGAPSVKEGDSGTVDLAFTVTRLGSTAGAASATYVVSGADASTNIANRDDFPGGQFPIGTVSFADGQSVATVVIRVAGDTIGEFDEGFTLTLSNPVGTTLLPRSSATGTILDDDTRYTYLTDGNDTFTGTAGVTEIVFGLGGDDLFRNVQLDQRRTQLDGGPGNDTLVIAGSSQSPASSIQLNITGIETIILQDGSHAYSLGNLPGGPLLVDARAVGPESTVRFSASSATTLTFYGGAGNDTVSGGNGNDLLVGNGGSNVLAGGNGNDIYVVSSAGDFVLEQVSDPRYGTGGFDIVYASVSFALKPFGSLGTETGAEIEVLSTQNQQGTEAINLVGNYFAQQVIGNLGNNVLNGNGGADTLIGLAGNDTYAIADANAVIVENPGEGYDIVYAQVGYTLTGTAEIEELSFATQGAADNLNIIGNAFAQKVIGNYGNNVLNGNGGADTLIGLLGNDTYVVNDLRAVIVENAGEGFDIAYVNGSYALGSGVSVELLSTATQAGTESYNLTGNASAQQIVGNNGANIIDGGAGADTLIGLGGADTFRFSTPLGGGNVDAITDFGNGADRIELSATVFTGLAAGTLSASSFTAGTTATGAAAQIVYDQASGQLFYDADGSGAGVAVLFATLAAGTVLTAGMITVN